MVTSLHHFDPFSGLAVGYIMAGNGCIYIPYSTNAAFTKCIGLIPHEPPSLCKTLMGFKVRGHRMEAAANTIHITQLNS